jgi:hypothetical protein
MKDFGDTHLLLFHHPKVFEGRRYTSAEPTEDEIFDLPPPQPMFTIVSVLNDSVVPDSVHQLVRTRLPNLGMIGLGLHESGKFELAKPKIEEEKTMLIRPAFGPIPGGARFFVFSSHPEAAAAVVEAAESADARMLADTSVQEAIAHLPREGSLAFLARGPVVRRALWDRVREVARAELNLPARYLEWRTGRYGSMPDGDEKNDRLRADGEAYVISNYPPLRDRYEQQIEPLDAIDVIAFGATLAPRKVTAKGYIRFKPR